ncbi:MAG: trigger factor [Thermaerobacter sp.]|nr:trigger factor [Thermaerobacter sp.]
MQVELEKLNEDEVRVTIAVDQERLQGALDGAFRKIAKRVNVPGFRPGKAPRPVVERAYGTQRLYEDALQDLVPKVYSEAIEQLEIKPYEDGVIEEIEPADEGVRVKARVLLEPEVKLPDYRAYPKEQPAPYVVPDGEIDRALEEERRAHATLVPAEVIGPESVVEMSGSYIDENGEAAQIPRTQIALDRAFPEFRDALLGAKVGDERQVPLEGAESDKTARVVVDDVRSLELPEVDDAFAQEHGHADLKEMREGLANALRAEAERSVESARRTALLDKVIREAEVRMPETLVEREAHSMLHERHGDAAHDHGEPDEEMLKEARERVRGKVVVGKLMEAEGIQLSQAEFDAARRALEENRRGQRLSDQELQSLYGILLDEKLRVFLGTLGEEPKQPETEQQQAE